MHSRLHNQCVYFVLKSRISTEAVMWLLLCGCLRITDVLPMRSFFSSCSVSNANVTETHKRSRYLSHSLTRLGLKLLTLCVVSLRSIHSVTMSLWCILVSSLVYMCVGWEWILNLQKFVFHNMWTKYLEGLTVTLSHFEMFVDMHDDAWVIDLAK